MLVFIFAYTPSYHWPMISYDEAHSGYQAVPGELSAGNWSVKWREVVGASMQNSSGPVLYDVRGDIPGEEVIVNLEDGVHCYNGNDGSEIWSFTGMDPQVAPNSTPAVGDVDGDGIPEVIVGHNGNGTVYCINGQTGALEWSNDQVAGQVMAPITLADLDGDGVPEILVGHMFSNTVEIYKGDGTLWRQLDLNGNTNASPTGMAVGDIDGDGAPEIVVAYQDGLPVNSQCIVAFDADGSEKWRWPSGWFLSAVSLTTPSIAEIDGDAAKEVYVGRLDDYSVYALDGDGSEIWQWTIPNNAEGETLTVYWQSLVAYDVDGDGRDEVFFGTGGGEADSNDTDTTGHEDDSWLVGLDHDGSLLFQFDISNWSYDGGGALCDIDMDGVIEFMKTTDEGYFYVLNALTGAQEWMYDFANEDYQEDTVADPPVAVGDIDGDYCSEVVILGGFGALYLTALDAPGSDCLLPTEESELRYGRLEARVGKGTLWLRLAGGEARAGVWNASGRLVRELKLGDGWVRLRVKPGVYFIKGVDKPVRGKVAVP